MDRRTFVGGVAIGFIVVPISAFAQAQEAKVYRIGVILERNHGRYLMAHKSRVDRD